MEATTWEFRNRALLFGLIFAGGFFFGSVDRENISVAVANRLGTLLHADVDWLAGAFFFVAALMLSVAALVRTWASAYLRSDVVYASDVKTTALVADGPYRLVRNPLYFGNVLMVIGMGALMSRVGFVVALITMCFFCYRLIFREEAELRAIQSARYQAYCDRVPRLWPSLRPRIPPSGKRPRWRQGFRAEFWSWGFALAALGFAITLSIPVFLVLTAVSVGVLGLSSRALGKDAG